MNPRIGVFICHCGSNIGGVVDVKKVCEYIRTLPDVTYVEDNLYTCSKDGLDSIRAAVAEHELNRVVVASCTPRTHEPLFKANCEKAGLNKYLFEFVNLREHCSWVHMRQPQEATEKAKDLVAMGVAKARLLEPQEETEIGVRNKALVIGGGVAGMSAAIALAKQRFEVHLVERGESLGGAVGKLNSLYPTRESAESLLKRTKDEIARHPNLQVHLGCEVKDVKGYVGNFDAALSDGSNLEVGAVIVATGGRELGGQSHWDNVVTQLQLEKLLQNGLEWRDVVMIQCVGFRADAESNGQPGETVNYCSRACCMTAIKNAQIIKERWPEARVHILYRELMTYGADFEASLRDAMKEGIRFLRYDAHRPPEIVGNGVAKKVNVHTVDGDLSIPVDGVVQTVPFVPALGREDLARMLKVPLSGEGFFLEAHVKLRPVEFATDGVFLCGTARAPACIPECVMQGYAAASKASALIAKDRMKVEAISAWADPALCSGCTTCAGLCPYHAIHMVDDGGGKKAQVNEAQCKGCGTCVGACPSGAMQQKGFTDAQILSMVDTAMAVAR